MKKIFCILSVAAVLFGTFSCKPKEDPIDVNDITEDGVYVAGEATGATAITAVYGMAKGRNEAKGNELRDGMYEKYIVLEGGKDFSLVYVNGGSQTAYGASLTEFKPTDFSGIYQDNPADAVFKGKLEIGESAPKMKVTKTGLYHIVLDLNLNNDLSDAQILVCPVTYGVRGGMNGWGFTALEATEAKNEGMTFTLSGQKLADGGEFKFAYNNAWKITLDEAGEVKANTNLGLDGVPGADNIAVAEGAGEYKITLEFKLAAGDVKNSWKYSMTLESASSTPTTMYMIGNQFGGWDWNNEGVVELVPVWGEEGTFWCTRYFTTDGFKFCAEKAWNGDFTGLGTDEGYTVADGNCFVPAAGFYTVFIDLLDKQVSITPAEVWGIGDAFGSNAWDFDADDPVQFEAEGSVMVGQVTNASNAVRVAVKVTAPGADRWFDWWKSEFIWFDGKIAYRGLGGDQERVAVNAGDVITIDFNAGTVNVEAGVPFVPAINVDGNFDDWAGIAGAEPAGAFNEFKITNDSKNFYFYIETDPGSRLWSGGAYLYLYFDFDNDLTTGDYSGTTGMGDNHYEAYLFMYLFGGNADAPEIVDNPNGGEAKGLSLDNIVIAGNQPATASDIVKMEIKVPRANFTDKVNAGDVIGIGSYRSKDGGNIHYAGYTVK